MTKKVWIVGLGLLGACGPDLQASCEAYIEANNGCVEEALGDTTVPDGALLDPETVCAPYDGLEGSAAKAQAEQLDCYATEIEAIDCSDAATYGTNMAAALSACATQ